MIRNEEAINYLENSMAIGNDDASRHHNEILEFIIKALEKEPCEDAVSKKAVLCLFNKSDMCSWAMSLLKRKIEEMPPVKPVACIAEIKFSKEDMQKLVNEKIKEITPTRKKGKWIDKEKIMFPICSKCGLTSVEKYSFCPNCGAEMQEEEE